MTKKIFFSLLLSVSAVALLGNCKGAASDKLCNAAYSNMVKLGKEAKMGPKAFSDANKQKFLAGCSKSMKEDPKKVAASLKCAADAKSIGAYANCMKK